MKLINWAFVGRIFAWVSIKGLEGVAISAQGVSNRKGMLLDSLVIEGQGCSAARRILASCVGLGINLLVMKPGSECADVFQSRKTTFFLHLTSRMHTCVKAPFLICSLATHNQTFALNFYRKSCLQEY